MNSNKRWIGRAFLIGIGFVLVGGAYFMTDLNGLTITGTETYTDPDELTIANSTVESSGNLTLKAGNIVRFLPGFHAKPGSELSAFIDPSLAGGPTNDPMLSQQYYLFDHNIDQAWTYNTGSSNTRIAIHSMGGFTSSHEDMEGTRYLNPWTEWFGPQHDYASEIAGIIGANSNNGIGMAGIDWNGTMKSYNILRIKQSGDDEPAATFTYDSQEYYLDIGKLDAMVNQAIQDNMDIHIFTFGVPSAKESDLTLLEDVTQDQYLNAIITPSFPTPDPEKPFWNALQDMVKSFGESIVADIKNQNYTPPSDLELFRQELWKVTQPANNGVNLAPVGDVQSQEQLEILMPAVMDNYVVTVGGARKDAGNQYFQWSNSQTATYVDVAAAANNIVSVSGTGYSAYNSDFNSTAASTGIAAGVVSLLKAENGSLTHDDIEQILERTATDIEDPGHDNKTGHGFVDAGAALAFVQNNEIHHKQATGSEVSIISDTETYPEWVDMSPAYLNFSQYDPTYARGKLRKVTGKVTFELPFVSTPEVWLRMTSSGIDNKIVNFEGKEQHFYDPYDKAFEVTSVTIEDFTFELYYWRIEYYELHWLVETRNIPDVNGLALDYTAVGTESTAPLEATISGPAVFKQEGEGTWDAIVSGGVTPYASYQWYIRTNSGDPWSSINGATGPSYSAWVHDSFELRVTVTDAANTTASSDAFPVSYIPSPQMTTSVSAAVPNPFNPSTNITYTLPEQAEVTLEVYNLMGRKVATLVNDIQQAGEYTKRFDASSLASGIYFARFTSEGTSGKTFKKTIKMQLIK